MNSQTKSTAKTCLRLAFLCFFAAGALLLGIAWEAQTANDRVFSIVLGFFFVGTAFFAGPMLFAAAEKCSRGEAQK